MVLPSQLDRRGQAVHRRLGSGERIDVVAGAGLSHDWAVLPFRARDSLSDLRGNAQPLGFGLFDDVDRWRVERVCRSALWSALELFADVCGRAAGVVADGGNFARDRAGVLAVRARARW